MPEIKNTNDGWTLVQILTIWAKAQLHVFLQTPGINARAIQKPHFHTAFESRGNEHFKEATL
jgi:hypothetical protein